MSDDADGGGHERHVIDLRLGGDALEAILRNVEHDIHNRGWGGRPHLMWIRQAGRRELEVFEPPLTGRMWVVAGDDPADVLDALAVAMPTLDATVLGIVFTAEADAVPHGGIDDVRVRQVFGLSIATQREVYLVRAEDGDVVRYRPPDGDTVLLALRRLARRAAAMRDPDPMRVPEQWS